MQGLVGTDWSLLVTRGDYNVASSKQGQAPFVRYHLDKGLVSETARFGLCMTVLFFFSVAWIKQSLKKQVPVTVCTSSNQFQFVGQVVGKNATKICDETG